MAWNDPGDNKKDPWGNGGNQPPDLDEVFRNLQKKINGLLGGGGSSDKKSSGNNSQGMGGLILLILVVALLWAASNSVYIVEQTQRGVVTQFGEYNRTVPPGLRFIIPGVERLERVDVTQIHSVEDDGEMLTRDENIVNIDFVVQYKVKNAENYLFLVRDPVMTLKQAAEAALRQVIGDSDMDYILGSGRAQISEDGLTILQGLLDRYETGLIVKSFNLQDIRPPQQVQGAFDDAVKAREDKETSVNEAQAYANGVLPVARGQAARITQEAEAYKSRVVSLSSGEASRFSQILTEYQKAPEVTRKRLYIETIEDVMSKTGKVMLGDKGGQLMMLPLQDMMRNVGQSSSAPVGTVRGNTTLLAPSSTQTDSFRNPLRNVNREPR